MQCVRRAVVAALLASLQLAALHVRDDAPHGTPLHLHDGDLVGWPMRRRQNDRALEPPSGGSAATNIPSVYHRLMKNAASTATRRWISGVPPDLAAALADGGQGSASPPKLGTGFKFPEHPPGVLDSVVGSRVAFPDGSAANGVLDPAALRQRNKMLRLRQKIAKFLNLFTVVQFPNEACEAPAVGLTGTCYHHLQCRSLGGHPGGACAQGYGVCCLFEKTCGGTTYHNATYFVSPPQAAEGSGGDAVQLPDGVGYHDCFLTVEKMHPDVTQLRLDFLHFELAGPTAGTCLEERFVVVSPDRNAPTPALCGTNTGQHMYVQVGGAGGAVRLGVQWRGSGGSSGSSGSGGSSAAPVRRWVVRITQLRAHDDGAAPPGCLQYHSGHAGQVQSFGYLGPGAGSYTNNLNYAICVRKEAGFCSITYSTESQPFQLLNEDRDGSPTIPPGQAGAEVFNCPSDYVVINGIRLCGERLNDASLDPDYTHNSPVTDSGSGPFVLPVRTNGNLTGRGFSLAYRQLACA